MILYKVRSVYSLYIYLTACLVADFRKPLWNHQLPYLFKYIEFQYLSSLANDLYNEVVCCPHVDKVGDTWSRALPHEESAQLPAAIAKVHENLCTAALYFGPGIFLMHIRRFTA
jgi:hypothetical protein